MEGKTQLRSDLKKFRAQRTSLKMAVLETLNKLGKHGIEFTDDSKRPWAINLEVYREFPVREIRMYENKLQLKDWDVEHAEWEDASFDWDRENWLELADVATLLVDAEIWD